MKRPDRKIIAAALCVLLLCGTVYYATVRMVPDRTLALLHRYGFMTAALAGGTRFHGGEFVQPDIQLDKDGFSTIRALRVTPDWAGLLAGHFIRGLVVDDMRLTGEWRNGHLNIAGWTPRLPPFPAQDSIVLNGIRLDLDTPAGSIRMETKGRLNREKDGRYKIEGGIFGKQHQLEIASTWTGGFSDRGDYAIEGEIDEADLRLDDLEMTRASGWLQVASVKDDPHALPILSGQLQMGRLSFADIPLGNATITIDGQAAALHAIIEAEVAGLPGMKLDADITQQGGDWLIKGAASTPDADDLLSFMLMLRQKLDARKSNALTSFLITPGNIERLRKDIAGREYDMLALQIDGPLSALNGTIIASQTKGGRIQRQVISLDPGSR
jgi:hypothetical protein